MGYWNDLFWNGSDSVGHVPRVNIVGKYSNCPDSVSVSRKILKALVSGIFIGKCATSKYIKRWEHENCNTDVGRRLCHAK